MSTEILRQRMIGILRSAPCRQINFRVGGFRVNAAGYEKIARLLGSRCAIKIAIEDDDVSPASYESKTNTVYFTEPDVGRSMGERALIVHELTHALEDEERRTMGELEVEVAAYVAGSLYVRYARQQSAGPPPVWPSRRAATRQSGRAHGIILVRIDGPSGPTLAEQTARLSAAADAAARSLDGFPGACLSAAHYQALANAVRDHEVYAGSADENKHTFDGIR